MNSNNSEHWKSSKRLVLITLSLWFFFGYVIHFFVDSLSDIVILGFPLGYYMAAQGSLIAFVVLLFWFVKKQNDLDEKHHVSEE